MKIKYFMLAEDAKLNEGTNRIDIKGAFDEIVQIFYPIVLESFVVVVGMEELFKNTLFELRVNKPDGSLLSKMEVGLAGVTEGQIAKKIIKVEKMPIVDRGVYTLDILEKKGEDDYKWLSTFSLFNAKFPPKRIFKEGEKEAILKSTDLIKSVKADYKLPNTDKTFRFELTLDENQKITEGYEKFPENNKITLENDKEVDLNGLRRHIEWIFGRKVEKKEEEKVDKNLN